MTMGQRNHLFDQPGEALAPKRVPRRVRRNASPKRHKKRRNDKHGGGRLAARGALKPALMERDHREFKATKDAFETAENTHFTHQTAT